MKRLLSAVIAVIAASFFMIGFTQCNPPPKFTCAHPIKKTGYHDGVAFPNQRRVNQNVWTEQGRQTMYICSPGNWRADVTQSGAPETGVKTFPDSERTYTNWTRCSSHTLASFTKMQGYYAHQAPNVGSWNAGWDIFLNGELCHKKVTEVMIWDQWRSISVPTAQLHPVIDGVQYDLYYHQNSTLDYFQFRRRVHTKAASVNLLAVLRYLQSRGFLKPTDAVLFDQAGNEILTTYGRTVPFWTTGFSVSDNK